MRRFACGPTRGMSFQAKVIVARGLGHQLKKYYIGVLQGMKTDHFLSLMAVDKKNVDGKLKLILLKGTLGNCVVSGDFDHSVLLQLLRSYCDE